MAHQTNYTWIQSYMDTLSLHSIYGCDIHLLVAIWSSVTHLLLYLGKVRWGMKTEMKEQQSEILPTIKELRPTYLSSPENHRSYNISIVDERKNYRELRKLLDSN